MLCNETNSLENNFSSNFTFQQPNFRTVKFIIIMTTTTIHLRLAPEKTGPWLRIMLETRLSRSHLKKIPDDDNPSWRSCRRWTTISKVPSPLPFRQLCPFTMEVRGQCSRRRLLHGSSLEQRTNEKFIYFWGLKRVKCGWGSHGQKPTHRTLVNSTVISRVVKWG